MEFIKTQLAEEIMNSDKTFSVPFHSKTGITVTENNIDFIIEIELKKAKEKVSSINDNIFIFENIEEKIIERYKSMLNKPYLVIEYAYLNKENLEDGVKTVETFERFYEWLVE